VALRWRCLEPGCGTVVTAASDDELVEAANVHVRDAHGSYELEEVILAGAERVAPEEVSSNR
jgi:predicted small metal-binding protein